MGELHIIDFAIYITCFLLGTTLLQIFSLKTSFPYTVTVLLAGFLSQFINHFFNLGIHISLSPEFIFFILLPILLFESAMRINIHQFKIQFRTITFLATFCLLLSVFIVGVGLMLLIGLPFKIALLFGAIISATDPIAVLALFKTLGAPKRLALIAEGESMFNDATGVITFRIVSGFVFGHQVLSSQTIFQTFGNFFYIFLGSIALGLILGYFCTVLLQKIKSDRISVSAVITALSIGSFAFAEHFFHLSGVITTVMAGIVFGNLARGKLMNNVTHFVEEYFEYMGFVSLSLVFFLATFTLNFELFTTELPKLIIVIFVVLLARAISVYVTSFLSNTLSFFKNEPNIPMAWQHIINWGGLRGVIPLVLVYSLPDSFAYKELMLQFTLATLLFTLFINGLTVKKLLILLKLHIPASEEKIMQDELKIIELEKAEYKLHNLPYSEFSQSVVKAVNDQIFIEGKKYKREFLTITNYKEIVKSLKLQSLEIERQTLHKLFEQGRLTEGVLYEFESELDLQRDILEYPHIYANKSFNRTGKINTKKPFRKRLMLLRHFVVKHKFLSNILHISERDIVFERYALLRARLFTSYAVFDYIKRMETTFDRNKKVMKAIKVVRGTHNRYVKKNQKEIERLSTDYSNFIISYQEKVIGQLISWKPKNNN